MVTEWIMCNKKGRGSGKAEVNGRTELCIEGGGNNNPNESKTLHILVVMNRRERWDELDRK